MDEKCSQLHGLKILIMCVREMFSLKWHYFIQKYILVDPLASLVIHSHIKEKPKWDFQKKAYLAYRNNKVFSNLNSKHGEKKWWKEMKKDRKSTCWQNIHVFIFTRSLFALFSVAFASLPLQLLSLLYCHFTNLRSHFFWLHT